MCAGDESVDYGASRVYRRDPMFELYAMKFGDGGRFVVVVFGMVLCRVCCNNTLFLQDCRLCDWGNDCSLISLVCMIDYLYRHSQSL